MKNVWQRLFAIHNLPKSIGLVSLAFLLQACVYQPAPVVIERPPAEEQMKEQNIVPSAEEQMKEQNIVPSAEEQMKEQNIVPSKPVVIERPVAVGNCEIKDYAYQQTFVMRAWAVPSNNFFIGEPLTLQMRVSAPAYVSIFHISTSCKVTRLLDNALMKVNEISNFPLDGSGIQMIVKPPPGKEGFYFVATRNRLNFLSSTDILSGTGDIASLDMSPEQFYSRLDQARNRIAPTDWSSWTLKTNVRSH